MLSFRLSSLTFNLRFDNLVIIIRNQDEISSGISAVTPSSKESHLVNGYHAILRGDHSPEY